MDDPASNAAATAPQPTEAEAFTNGILLAVEERFAARFDALEADLVDASSTYKQLLDSNRELKATVEVLSARLTASIAGQVQVTKGPRVNALAVYDGKDRELADQWLRQIVRAAAFETFKDDTQKIMWAETFLISQALAWSSIITASTSDADALRTDWDAYTAAFKGTFCPRDPGGDALTRLNALTQGSKSITEYTTIFRELVAKLPPEDRNSTFVNNRYWEGLSVLSKEALVNTDFKTADEAQDILLRREKRLDQISAQKKASGYSGVSRAPVPAAAAPRPAPVAPRPSPAAASVVPARPAQSLPPPPRDPNAMDIDGTSKGRRCYGCGETGHIKANCPKTWASVRAAIVAEVTAGLSEEFKSALSLGRARSTVAPAVAAADAPAPGFV